MSRKIPWTLSEIIEVAKTYTNRADWQAANSGQYDAAHRQGWLPEIYLNLPRKKPIQKFSDHEIIELALTCRTMKDLNRLSPACVRALRKRPHIKDEATSHMEPTANKKDYLCAVYSFSFEDKSFYVGITTNHHNRYTDHTRDSSTTSVGKYIRDNPDVKFEYNVLHSGLRAKRAQEREGFILRCAIDMGLRPLNCTKTGSLGGSQVWDIEVIKKIMLKYDNVKDAYKKDKKAYKAACNRGILAEVTSHMSREYKTWNMEDCISEAQKHNTFAEWRKSGGASVEFVRRSGFVPSEFFKMHTKREYTTFQRIFWNSTAKENKDVAWAWANADMLRQMWLDNNKCGHHRLYNLLSLGSYSAYVTIVKQFKLNWIPNDDKFWVTWAEEQRRKK